MTAPAAAGARPAPLVVADFRGSDHRRRIGLTATRNWTVTVGVSGEKAGPSSYGIKSHLQFPIGEGAVETGDDHIYLLGIVS